jgi:NitT/TauT family transport system ATP-binding protein
MAKQETDNYLIEFKDVCQSYPDKKDVIKGFDLIVDQEPGTDKVIGILGPSGCGKSTILRYLSALQKPTSGGVFIKGEPITDNTVVGMVFQQYSSLPWYTVLENVALGLELRGVPLKERTEKAMEMIKLVGLEGHEKKRALSPALSGGQLQRVAIGRSLLANSQILLMDEPFGALDVSTRLSMQELLRSVLSMPDDMTVMFVTHDIPEAVYLSDEIQIMGANPGRIVDTIELNWPKDREPSIKREPKFVKMVYDIEDRMAKLKKQK